MWREPNPATESPALQRTPKEQGAEEVRSYGGHDATGVSSQGALSPGGASGADYQTTNTGNTGDSDSGDLTGY